MTEPSSDKSFGDLPTIGHEEVPSVSPSPSSESPSWTAQGLSGATTLKPPEGLLDDARTDAPRRWRPGDILLGRYVVEGELGQGGMGVVYSCLDRTGGVRVAVKCLPPELSHNSVEMEEVRENFRLVVDLRHPCIAGVRTLEKDERGEYFLVMDIAEGENLRKWMRSKWKSGGIPLPVAVPVLRQVASALDYAHGRKIVHRDIKPGNVMIAPTGEVKVLDFGLADQIRTSLSRASQAYRGTSGTGPYMSPEQWRGRQQNGKTDQYALAVMAYEMLSGHLPFDNSDPGVLREVVLKEDPEPIPSLPAPAMAALRRALSKTADARFPTCADFVAALSGQKYQASSSNAPVLFWLVTLILALAVGSGIWWWQASVSRQRQKAAAQQAEAQRLAEEAARQAELERQAKEESARKAEQERLEAEKRAAEERAAAEKRAEEERLAREAAEQAAREQTEREQAAREAQQRAEEAERRAREAEEAKQKAEAEAAQRQRELEARLAKLEQQANPPVARTPIRTTAVPQTVTPQSTSGRPAGTTKTITLSSGAKMEMVWCPPGSFMMGSPPNESERLESETQHQVTLTKGFWMAKYEVTEPQWQSVMGGFWKRDNVPVSGVNWHDCQEFCRKAGNGLRLPTEAEWEYACRAGTTGAYAGDIERLGWARVSGKQAVGQKQPNAWGLYDMHGNLAEWCEDRGGLYPSGPVTNPTGAATGTWRITRGGSWYGPASYCRSACRGWSDPASGSINFGFRPVCSD